MQNADAGTTTTGAGTLLPFLSHWGSKYGLRNIPAISINYICSRSVMGNQRGGVTRSTPRSRR